MVVTFRIGQRRQAERRCACESKDDVLSSYGMQRVARGILHDGSAECVRQYQTRIGREDVARHIERGRKEQAVAMQPVISPFAVGAEVGGR